MHGRQGGCSGDTATATCMEDRSHMPHWILSDPASGVLEGNDRESAVVLSEELCRNVGETRLGGTGRSSWGGVVER